MDALGRNMSGGVFYRRVDFTNKREIECIARADIEIPALFDTDFSTDEEAFQQELKRFEKFTDDDFFDVAFNNENQVVGFHIIKKTPYFDRFAGSIYTLWVTPEFRNKGI
ncbi:MAG: GNAT family N-acetyltransferase, partial [Bacteriovorax sp.]